MKQYLLPNKGKFYKACLHVHSRVSDGNREPEEIKEEYMAHGYSIVAFSDHDVMVPHNDLTDENFLALTAVEVSVNSRKDDDFDYVETIHFNVFSRDPEKTFFACFDAGYVWMTRTPQYVTDELREKSYTRHWGMEHFNEMFELCNKDDCLVMLNHPVWSQMRYNDYIDMKGLWGVECYNHESYKFGFEDTMTPIDDLLRKGERVIPTATDDAHRAWGSFGGWMMIKSEALRYEDVFDAMKRGDLYASTGPEIKELWIENGKVHVETSPCLKIVLSTERRTIFKSYARDGETITWGEYDINNYIARSRQGVGIDKNYFRITVTDEWGRKAYSRAYFLDELEK